ncbi:MAG: hypothetical protein F7B60_05800 [Desulfurococcales archaeon]|nr:hypothetical protein [Desulfurococcales archaeon]
MGTWLLAFTFGATYFSSVVIVVGGMWGYLWGSWSLLIPLLNVTLGVLVTFKLIGPKVSVLGDKLKALTIPELLAKTHKTGILQSYLGSMAAIGLTLYAATVVAGASVMLATVLNITLTASAVILVSVIAAYVVLSGMYGIVWTDALQGVVMATGVALLAGAAITVSGVKAAVIQSTPLSSKFPGLDLLLDIAIITSVAVWGLPQMLNRFYTVKEEKVVNKAGLIALGFAILVTFGSYSSGIMARSLLGSVPPPKVIPLLAESLLGPWGAAIMAAAIIAASMSTMDSIGLTVGSSLAYDLLGKRDVRSVRLISSAVMIAVLAIVIGMFNIPSALSNTLTSVFKLGWSITGIAFIPPVLSMVTGRGNRESVLVGSVTGILSVLLYSAAGLLGFSLPFNHLSFTISLAISLIISLLPRGG